MELINREISWLAFNDRVLQEAEDQSVPLIERMRFLGIFSNNLDEFFRVRVASLTRLSDLGKKTQAKLEDDPKKILSEVAERIRGLQIRRDKAYQNIKYELGENDIFLINHKEIPSEFKQQVKAYFYQELRPKLVPLMLDEKRDLPDLNDKSIYLFSKLELVSGELKYALIEVPRSLPRFYVIKETEGYKVLYIEDIIRYRLSRIFKILDVAAASSYTIKVTRDAELDLDDDFSKSILAKMEKSVRNRRKGNYVRCIYDRDLPEDMLDFLRDKLKIRDAENVIAGGKYHNKKDLMSFPTLGKTDLIYKPLIPLRHRYFKNKKSFIEQIQKKDILLHTPYQRFDYITAFLREAAIDPKVRAISMTLYRVSSNSDIINALVNAAQNGKKVTVVIELQARFDESNNIKYSDLLKESGAEVLFGFPKLKVHSKLILVQRRIEKINSYIGFVGTGNFHEKNGKIYEDLGVFTAKKKITKDLKNLFNLFDNALQHKEFNELVVSPLDTRNKFSELILNEIKNVQNGLPSGITLKLNNLVDKDMIFLLYEASKKGVKIRLIIRGICSLVPGVKGLSENIEVRSIVGRFLEHSRVLIFENAGDKKIFISSADWMTRNLDRRVEVSLPILDEEIANRLSNYLDLQWTDNLKARIIDKDLKNERVERKGDSINSQVEIYKKLKSDLTPFVV